MERHSVEAYLAFEGGHCRLTFDSMDVAAVIMSVASDSSGANAIFIGTTRNSFKGKEVTKLEYQAYSKLAINTIRDILQTARSKYTQDGVSSIIRCVVEHRLGVVPVGEASIVIAVSSPHRKEAFQACELILEQVKENAQIWKREFYRDTPDHEAQWKSNSDP